MLSRRKGAFPVAIPCEVTVMLQRRMRFSGVVFCEIGTLLSFLGCSGSDSVEYAERSGETERIGSLAAPDVQRIIGEACPEGSYLRGWNHVKNQHASIGTRVFARSPGVIGAVTL